MSLAIKVYEAFKDDENKAKILADVIEQIEMVLKSNQVATQQDLINTQVALTKEIEKNRADLTIKIEQVRAELTKEIEKVRADLKIEIEQVRSDLIKEIEKERTELTIVMHNNHVSALRWLVTLMITQLLAISGIFVALIQLFLK